MHKFSSFNHLINWYETSLLNTGLVMETNYLMASISGRKSNKFNSKTRREHEYMKYKSVEKSIYMSNHEQEPDTSLHIHMTIFGV